MEYNLLRARRKTIAIVIRPDGTLEVRAPLRAARAEIDRALASRESWITEKLMQVRQQAEKKAAFCLNYGDPVLYRGREYPIAAKPGKHIGFDETCFYMPPGLDNQQIKAACVKIYRHAAKQYITERTLFFARGMGVMPSAVKINAAKTRWGSCSAQKSINFSWRLIMAEDDVIDYVVVHELSHLTQMNHSPRFWAVVSGVLPDYKSRQKKLKELQRRLCVQDWG